MSPAATAAHAQPDGAAIRATLALLAPPGAVIELRVPKTRRAGTVSGYYDRPEVLAEHARAINRSSTVYITLNTLHPALLARGRNRPRAHAQQTTSDHDIVRWRWLFIDVDATRPSGVSASDAEHAAALALAEQIRTALTAAGWPAPVVADSGNGGHLLYRLDLANEPASTLLLRGVLAALAFRFDTAAATVDRSTFNAARVGKLYGTVARKGEDAPDRPHRLTRVLAAPAVPCCVTREQLAALAAQAPPAEQPRQRAGHVVDVDAFLAAHALAVAQRSPWQGGTRWLLAACPWNAAHGSGTAYVVQFPSGALAAGCLKASCAGHGWRELRALTSPLSPGLSGPLSPGPFPPVRGERGGVHGATAAEDAPYPGPFPVREGIWHGAVSAEDGTPEAGTAAPALAHASSGRLPLSPLAKVSSPRRAGADPSALTEGGKGAGGIEGRPRLRLRRYAEIAPEALRWLWEPYVPAGKLTLLIGDGGTGKSTVAYALAAAVSTGGRLAGSAPLAAGEVLVAQSEDGEADTVVPRLIALGADRTRIHAIEGVLRREREGLLTLDADGIAALAETFAGLRPRLLLIDPLMSVLGASTDIYRDNEVRGRLGPLVALLARSDCACLGIVHISKGQRDVAQHRALGGVGLTNIARSVLALAPDPAAPDSPRRVLAPAKGNLGPAGVAQGFTLRDGGLVWTGPRPELTAARLFAPPEDPSGALLDAEAFLRTALVDGARPARDVLEAAAAQGVAEKTLRRAAGRLGVVMTRRHEPGKRGSAGGTWRLPRDGDSDGQIPYTQTWPSESASAATACGGPTPFQTPLPQEPPLSDAASSLSSEALALSDEEISASPLLTAADAPLPAEDTAGDSDSGGQTSVYGIWPSESAAAAAAPEDAPVCPACGGPLNERGICWACEDRPCVVCGAATGSALQRCCSYACQQRDSG